MSHTAIAYKQVIYMGIPAVILHMQKGNQLDSILRKVSLPKGVKVKVYAIKTGMMRSELHTIGVW